jgi:hypothetical protein
MSFSISESKHTQAQMFKILAETHLMYRLIAHHLALQELITFFAKTTQTVSITNQSLPERAPRVCSSYRQGDNRMFQVSYQ